MRELRNVKLPEELTRELADFAYDYDNDPADSRAKTLLVLFAVMAFQENHTERELMFDEIKNVIFPKTESYFNTADRIIEQAFVAALSRNKKSRQKGR
ncbi:MAG TPA: hypothetical protein VF648_07015 [Pyrinomonadaceae bacterium]|jgi:hypothetical protein